MRTFWARHHQIVSLNRQTSIEIWSIPHLCSHRSCPGMASLYFTRWLNGFRTHRQFRMEPQRCKSSIWVPHRRICEIRWRCHIENAEGTECGSIQRIHHRYCVSDIRCQCSLHLMSDSIMCSVRWISRSWIRPYLCIGRLRIRRDQWPNIWHFPSICKRPATEQRLGPWQYPVHWRYDRTNNSLFWYSSTSALDGGFSTSPGMWDVVYCSDWRRWP